MRSDYNTEAVWPFQDAIVLYIFSWKIVFYCYVNVQNIIYATSILSGGFPLKNAVTCLTTSIYFYLYLFIYYQIATVLPGNDLI